jgi:hypothetical protein
LSSSSPCFPLLDIIFLSYQQKKSRKTWQNLTATEEDEEMIPTLNLEEKENNFFRIEIEMVGYARKWLAIIVDIASSQQITDSWKVLLAGDEEKSLLVSIAVETSQASAVQQTVDQVSRANLNFSVHSFSSSLRFFFCWTSISRKFIKVISSGTFINLSPPPTEQWGWRWHRPHGSAQR